MNNVIIQIDTIILRRFVFLFFLIVFSLEAFCADNRDSISKSNISLNGSNNEISGKLQLCSHLLIAVLLTPNFSANCACVSPFSFL